MRIQAAKQKMRPVSKLASKMYSPETVARKTATATRGDEDMQTIFNNIMHDPHITLGDPDKSGNIPIFYYGKDIGWMNPEKFMGWIDDKEYDKLQKYVPPTLPTTFEDELYIDDEYNEDMAPRYVGIDDDYFDIDASSRMRRHREVMSASETAEDRQLRKDLEYALEHSVDLIEDVVNEIYSNTGDFDKDIFTEAKAFFEENSKEDMQDLLSDFFFGEDYDKGGSANPTRKFFRRDSDKNVQSTDVPGEIYQEEILDDIVDYIMKHSDDTYYPDEILDILEPEDDEE